MLMKKLRRYLGAMGLLLLMGVATSCIKDNIATTSDADAVNITVNVGSRAVEVDEDNSEVLANEDIKTIRLILVQNGKVVSNSKHSFTASDGQKLLKQGIRIIGLKKAVTHFYAVVNNESAGEDLKIGDTFEESSLDVQLGNELTSDTPLPMYGKLVGQEEIKDEDKFEIPVTRAVARVDLNITNNTGSDLNIKSVDFGPFIADKGYLITSQGKDIKYSSREFPVEEANMGEYHFYLYEAIGLDYKNFTIGMTTADTKYDQTQIIVPADEQAQLLKRNTILQINATVNSSSEPITIEISVKPWESVELPPLFE